MDSSSSDAEALYNLGTDSVELPLEVIVSKVEGKDSYMKVAMSPEHVMSAKRRIHPARDPTQRETASYVYRDRAART